jgi:heavy metal translocating P-type ATPase
MPLAMSARKPRPAEGYKQLRGYWNWLVAAISLAAIALYLLFHFLLHYRHSLSAIPLWDAIAIGGVPLLYKLLVQIWRRQFKADFLAGLSIITAVWVGELLVATIVILMLSGGQALEDLATRRASSVLNALARRMPNVAHRIESNEIRDISVADIRIGDRLAVLPHEICPVDGTVESGTGMMDESFLTGEPFQIRKTAGAQVISGALNGESALTMIADKVPSDSRYERIMQVMRRAQEEPPAIRRLADRLGAFYTPVAVLIALAAWLISGDSERFLAALVIATPCPLLLAIPVSIISAISLAAKHGIVIKKPVVLEQVGQVRTMFFDKTGTLTHGEPVVTEVVPLSGASDEKVLQIAAGLEQYSKHPLSGAILRAARERNLVVPSPTSIREKPGEGLSGQMAGDDILITGRQRVAQELLFSLPPPASGMECIVIVNGRPFGLIRFHDRPRQETKPFIGHLKPKHRVRQMIILSGDRDAEARHLAAIIGIHDVRAGLSPEQKLEIVKQYTAQAPTLFLGDGINDAPAMLAATVGIAFGQNSDITAEAASAVIMDPTLGRVDELLHIGKRLQRIALESAVGGMVLSVIGMFLAAGGLLPPIAGAICQEGIDLFAVLNALRASRPGKELRDF